MRSRRTLLLVSMACVVASASIACGLSTIGTGDPFYGTFDGASDHTIGDGQDDIDGAVVTDGSSSGDATMEAAANDAASVDAGVDARVGDGGPQCSAACATAGGSCDAGNLCTIDCTNSSVGGCATPTCPAGHSCIIKCGGGNCHGAVSCANARACDIQCTGGDSCQGGVTCGGDVCTVECGAGGGGSCKSPITCTAARCSVTCSAGDTCTKDITCSSAIGCSISCSNGAVCPSLALGAPDAAISCGVNSAGGDCKDVSCYADGGKCNLGCGTSSCSGKICCSGKCTGTNDGAGVPTCP